MATRCSLLILVVVLICAIHFNSLDVEAFKNKGDDCCCSTYDTCDSGGISDNCCGSGGGKKRYKSSKKSRYYDDDDCDCCDYSDCCGSGGGKKDFKEDLKEKIFRKFNEKRERKERKRMEKKRKKSKKFGRCDNDECCDDCRGNDDSYDASQKIIVENGPAIIQTVIVDKDLYARYGVSCFESPLQKIVVQDEDSCYFPPTKNNYYNPSSAICQEECDPQNVKVVVKDPYYRSQYYPGYYGYT